MAIRDHMLMVPRGYLGGSGVLWYSVQGNPCVRSLWKVEHWQEGACQPMAEVSLNHGAAKAG
jgi:hypothetical protein